MTQEWPERGFFVQMVSLGKGFGERTVSVPVAATLLRAGSCGEELILWFRISAEKTKPDGPRTERKFLLIGDGTWMFQRPEDYEYITTVTFSATTKGAPAGVIIPAAVAKDPNAVITLVTAVHVFEQKTEPNDG